MSGPLKKSKQALGRSLSYFGITRPKLVISKLRKQFWAAAPGSIVQYESYRIRITDGPSFYTQCKDEFVHQQHCTAGELWLHSILFVLHPLVFLVAGLIWYFQAQLEPGSNLWLGLHLQLFLTAAFFLYQIIYWSFLWKPNPK